MCRLRHDCPLADARGYSSAAMRAAICGCGNVGMRQRAEAATFGCGTRGCGNVRKRRRADAATCGCGNVRMRQRADATTCGCGNVRMRQRADNAATCGCGDVRMRQCADATMCECGDVWMRRCVDATPRNVAPRVSEGTVPYTLRQCWLRHARLQIPGLGGLGGRVDGLNILHALGGEPVL
jgi:hypothetical protein